MGCWEIVAENGFQLVTDLTREHDGRERGVRDGALIVQNEGCLRGPGEQPRVERQGLVAQVHGDALEQGCDKATGGKQVSFKLNLPLVGVDETVAREHGLARLLEPGEEGVVAHESELNLEAVHKWDSQVEQSDGDSLLLSLLAPLWLGTQHAHLHVHVGPQVLWEIAHGLQVHVGLCLF